MSTALAPTQSRAVAMFDEHHAEELIRPFLPVGVSYDRVVAAAQLAAQKDPKILLCTPQSVIMSVARIQQWGLEIGTTAHLVPFGTECTPIADYKGLAHLMIESGAVRYVDARCVYANEFFEQEQGSDARLVHRPISDVKTRGQLIGAYCVLRLPFGQSVFDFMPLGEIDAIRLAKSKQWKSGPCPGWYAKKTVIRQVSKLIPKGKRIDKVIGVIEEEAATEFGAPQLAAPDEDEVIAPAHIASHDDGVRADEAMSLEAALGFIVPVGKSKGCRLDELTAVQMRAALIWTAENDTQPQFQEALSVALLAHEAAMGTGDGAPSDSPAGKSSDLESSSSAPALPLEPGQAYCGDPYPDDLASKSPGELKATAMLLLKHPAMSEKFVKGTKEQLDAGLSSAELVKTVKSLRAMIAAAPPKREKGERRSHSTGELPGGA